MAEEVGDGGGKYGKYGKWGSSSKFGLDMFGSELKTELDQHAKIDSPMLFLGVRKMVGKVELERLFFTSCRVPPPVWNSDISKPMLFHLF